MKYEILEETSLTPTKIKVIGIGGGGCNAINRMIESNVRNVEFIAANTDVQALSLIKVPIKIQLGCKLTKGLGAGGDPEIGEKAALEDKDKIQAALKDSHMIFVTCGMGGGTGTGGSPIVAGIGKELNSLVVGVVTKPFLFEGRWRMEQAEKGIEKLLQNVDTLIVIPNQNIFRTIDRKTSIHEAFKLVDDVLRQAVQGISDIISFPGLINVDFADVKSIMKETGAAIMGIGVGKGENRALEAIQSATSSPLLEETLVNSATGVLLNITGGDNLKMYEVEEIVSFINSEIDSKNAKIIFGATYDPELQDEIKVILVATGIKKRPVRKEEVQQEKPTKVIPFELFPHKNFEKPAFLRYQDSKEPKSKIEHPSSSNIIDEHYDIPTFLRNKLEEKRAIQ